MKATLTTELLERQSSHLRSLCIFRKAVWRGCRPQDLRVRWLSRQMRSGAGSCSLGLIRLWRGCRPNRTPLSWRRDHRQSISLIQPFPSAKRARQAEANASPDSGLALVRPPRHFAVTTTKRHSRRRSRAEQSEKPRLLQGEEAPSQALPLTTNC